MSLLLATGTLFLAVLLLAIGRIAFAGAEARGDVSFGPAEAVAYVFTFLVTAGVAMIGSLVFNDPSPALLMQVGGALAGLAVVCYLATAALGRRARPLPPAGEGFAGATPQRAGRPGPAPASAGGARSGRRAA